MITPGLVSVTFRQLPPERIVALAAAGGLASIEWGGDVHVPHGNVARAREVRAMTADAGLVVSAYGSYYRAGAAEQEGTPFGSVLETAIELGAPLVRVWAGVVGSHDADIATRRAVVNDLGRICDAASRAGVGVSLEFHANTLADTAADAIELIRDVGSTNLTSFWQPPNGISADTALQGLQSLLPHVCNVHVFHWWPDRRHRLPLSDGADRWSRYLTAIRPSASPTSASLRHASLEFVAGDDPETFRRDAATLIRLVESIRSSPALSQND